jgi:GT2 family glycosyltransferase
MNQVISVIIVNYNVKELLQECIDSIMKFCPKDFFEIIVIDNASNDGSIEMVMQKFPECIVISNKSNVGFSEANNQGIRIAKGDYIMLLNPDTELMNNSLTMMINYLKINPDICVLAPRLLNTNGSLQISCWRFPTVTSIILETLFLHRIFKVSQYPIEFFDSIFETDFAIGACLIFREELINKIGFLDPDLFWMEDVDFCYRAKSVGKIVYYLEAEIIHHSGQSLRQNYKVAISNQIISKLKYLRKHFNYFKFAIGVFFSFLHILTRAIIFILLSPFNTQYSLKAKAYFYSLIKLLNYLFLRNQTVN